MGWLEIEEPCQRLGTHILRNLAVRSGKASRRMRRVITEFASEVPFEQAATRIKEHYTVDVPRERVWRVCLAEAKRVAGKEPEKVRWVETRLLAARKLGSASTHYQATSDDVNKAGELWSVSAARAGWGTKTRIHVVSDGAPWIEQQSQRQFGRQSRYLTNRKDQLDYPYATDNSLPVGSGLIESGNRHVLQSRLKRAGTWWNLQSLRNMTQLRIAKAEGQWNDISTN